MRLKDNFEQWKSKDHGKLWTKKIKKHKHSIKVCFFKYCIGWSLKPVAQNDLFHLFISILGAKMSSVYKASHIQNLKFIINEIVVSPIVDFINILCRYFSCKVFKPKLQLYNFWHQNFVQKSARVEIDTWWSSSFVDHYVYALCCSYAISHVVWSWKGNVFSDN